MMFRPVSLILDFETTGVDPLRDRVLEVGVILTDWHEIYAALHSYVNPEYDFGHNEVNDLSYTQVKDAPTFKQLAFGCIHYIVSLADELVAFQSAFDLSFLREELARSGLHTPKRPVFDPWRRDTKLSLQAQCFKYQIPTDDVQWHSAMGDCIALFRLTKRLREGVETDGAEVSAAPISVSPRFR